MSLVFDISKKNKIITYFYILIFGLFYFVLPLILSYFQYFDTNACNKVAAITMVSIVGFFLGINVYNNQRIAIKKVKIDYEIVANWVFGLFILIVLLIVVTSNSIPIIESLKGVDQQELVTSREEFLKAREGWQSYLAYIVSTIDTTFLPYVVVFAFSINSKRKYFFLGIFFLYSICFLEKAYFFKVGIPLFTYFLYQSKNRIKFLLKGGAIAFIFVVLMYLASKTDTSVVQRDDPFFSALHTPESMIAAIVWRSIGIPVATVLDSVEIFLNQYNYLFYGATSSFIAAIFGMDRVNFERIVYFSQFGGGGTGNANQCYIVEAFINFGFIGVALFSFFIGRLLNMVLKSKDIVAMCIMPLFLFNLFNAGLIGNLLSNGFLLFFLMVRFVKIE